MRGFPFTKLLVLLPLATAGCTINGPSEHTLVDPGPLEGMYNGKEWRAGQGSSTRFSPNSNTIVCTLSEANLGGCDAHGFEKLVLEVPFKPGVYDLNLNQTVHFVFNNGVDDLEATDGELIVHEVTETTIKAGLYAIYNGNPNYEVSGQFVVARCPF
ncbi:MAG: hypothetical protein U0441_02620 [Polyangiaceae bacterium]